MPGRTGNPYSLASHGGADVVRVPDASGVDHGPTRADLECIAAAAGAVPPLFDEIRRLRTALDEAEAHVASTKMLANRIEDGRVDAERRAFDARVEAQTRLMKTGLEEEDGQPTPDGSVLDQMLRNGAAWEAEAEAHEAQCRLLGEVLEAMGPFGEAVADVLRLAADPVRAKNYVIAQVVLGGRALGVTIRNSVCPDVAEAIVRGRRRQQRGGRSMTRSRREA